MATLESGNPLKRASTYWHCYMERIQWKNLSKKILTLVFSLGFWEGRGVFSLGFLAVFVQGLLKPGKFFIKIVNLILVVHLVSKELFFSFFSESHKWQLLSQNQSSDIWCLELIDFGRFGVILGDF